MNKRNKYILALCISTTLALNNSVQVFAKDTNELIKPHAASYGYYIDVYKNNESNNLTPESNPSIGVLSKFLDLWQPGTEWNNGKKLNSDILNKNIEMSKIISSSRNSEMERNAYLDDRRNQSYSIISGLGPYSDEFKKGTTAGTTISDSIPNNASSVLYNDEGNINGNWAEENSTYGNIVKLVDTVRGNGASTSSAKKYYKYMRPFRWDNGSTIQDSLLPAKKSDPSNDGGYPSGHTNAAYLTALSLAYAVPERYDNLLTRASELGNNRIVCGMHSCLDVMGGRIMATAITAAALNDADNKNIKSAALESGKSLINNPVTENDDFSDYKTNKEKYIKRLTYGFKQSGDTTKEMRVPKGAEVLLESRLPYLDSTERRYVLYTTGLPSGYPILDDEEGWGRLNLFEASNGYGAFLTNVTVNMDAYKGGFNASDNWRNDINGTGSLTKEGTGSLTLSGNNSYTGDTIINKGSITAESPTALGNGNVINNSKLTENYKGEININGSYTQKENSVLELNISSKEDILKISGTPNLHGNLILNFTDGFVPEDNMTVISYSSPSNSKFDNITINGLSNKEAVYTDKGITITDKSNSSTTDIEKTQLKNEQDTKDTTTINDNNNGKNNLDDNSDTTTLNNVVKTGYKSPLITLLIALAMLYILQKNYNLKTRN